MAAHEVRLLRAHARHETSEVEVARRVDRREARGGLALAFGAALRLGGRGEVGETSSEDQQSETTSETPRLHDDLL